MAIFEGAGVALITPMNADGSVNYEKLDEIRAKADELILNIWNEVEGALQPIDNNEKRDTCSSYGIVYFYRPNERQKAFLSMN